MIRRPIARCLVLALLAVASTGCATFREGAVPETSPWPPNGSAKGKSLSLLVTGSASVNQKTAEPPPALLARWRAATQKTYTDSKLFSSVLGEGSPADVRAEVRINDVGEANQALSFLTGLTLFLFPSRSVDHFTMRTDFKNAQGNTLATIEKSDSVSTWMELFMVFAMPFKAPGPAIDDLLRDLARATLADAHAKGII